MKYDFWIRGGRVVDPAQGTDEVRDILIYNSRIMPLPENGEIEADEVIDAAGYLVTPGLIDFHTHLAYRNSDVGLSPDLYTLPNGITAAVDAGSAGTANFEGLLRGTVASSAITMKCFLNVAATGIITEQYFENLEPKRYDVKRMEYLFERYADEILGFKVRIGKRFSKEMNLKPLKAAVKLGERFHCPVCVHAVYPESDYEQILNILRPGDILCHCFQEQGPYTILAEDGTVQQCVKQARERGVIFDGASGRANHSLSIMQKAIEDGFQPDVISTDVVTHSIYRKTVFSLLRTMSEYLALGMPLFEVVKACTQTPAKLMRLEGKIGTLAPGALADVAILNMLKKPVTFEDMMGNHLEADTLFVPEMTIKAGRIAFRKIEFTF